MTLFSGPMLWAVIAAAGLCTYAFRAGFVFLHDRLGALPPTVQRALTYVPAAVLAALVAPSFLVHEEQIVLTFTDGRLPAGVAAVTVARYTENMLATIAIGMIVFWGVRFLL